MFGAIAVLAIVLNSSYGSWSVLGDWVPWVTGNPLAAAIAGAVVIAGIWLLHRGLRRLAAKGIRRKLEHDEALGADAPAVARAFGHNVRSWWPISAARPAGWSKGTRRRLDRVLNDAHAAIQRLNDRYTDPAGTSRAAAAAEPARPAAEPGTRTDAAAATSAASGASGHAAADVASAGAPAVTEPSQQAAPPESTAADPASAEIADSDSEPGYPAASSDATGEPAIDDESAAASSMTDKDKDKESLLSIWREKSAG